MAFVLATWVIQLLVRRALPALLPVSLHAILTPEEHRQRFVLARTLLADFRQNLHLAITGQRRAFLAGRVPAQLRQQMSALFQRPDQDGNGDISAAELLDGLGIDPQQAGEAGVLAAQLVSVLQAMDLDGDGRVDADEFGELRFRLLNYLLSVDAYGDDRLDPAELRRLLASVGERPLNAEEESFLFSRSPHGLTWLQFVGHTLPT